MAEPTYRVIPVKYRCKGCSKTRAGPFDHLPAYKKYNEAFAVCGVADGKDRCLRCLWRGTPAKDCCWEDAEAKVPAGKMAPKTAAATKPSPVTPTGPATRSRAAAATSSVASPSSTRGGLATPSPSRIGVRAPRFRGVPIESVGEVRDALLEATQDWAQSKAEVKKETDADDLKARFPGVYDMLTRGDTLMEFIDQQAAKLDEAIGDIVDETKPPAPVKKEW
jgi:hypothetical protein